MERSRCIGRQARRFAASRPTSEFVTTSIDVVLVCLDFIGSTALRLSVEGSHGTASDAPHERCLIVPSLSLVCRRWFALITKLKFVVFLFCTLVAICLAKRASVVSQGRCTSLGSLGQVDLKQAILRHGGPIAAHLVAVGPTALPSMLLRMPSTREERG